MTVAPEALPDPVRDDPTKAKAKEQLAELHPLESLFVLGYAESPQIEIYKDDKVELKAKFRTLTPLEIRDITEEITKFFSPTGQTITEQIETLARAVQFINYMPLILTREDQQKFFDENKRMPSPLEMARIILRDKVKSVTVLNALYETYVEFSNEVVKKFDEAKKKSRNLST